MTFLLVALAACSTAAAPPPEELDLRLLVVAPADGAEAERTLELRFRSSDDAAARAALSLIHI